MTTPEPLAEPLPGGMPQLDSEFPRWVDIRAIDEAPLDLAATPRECTALARRFAIVRVDHLTAKLALAREGAVVTVRGRLTAAIVQSCAISAEDLAVTIDEPLDFRFVPTHHHKPDEELELTADECDEIEFTGTRFDVGEAVAQSLALAIDPFAQGPDADRVRREVGLLGEGAVGPFAALAALKGKKD